ncbi:leader peptidase (prepilin peptidase) / N-methyltransferase [Sporobacter termitidis DSM 10068]|uniref:Leader peptidase (Prepilin peptidase) / N-methyltransferase n=1 Tax=Sporobacter termitidis DSM 10068 TaxID=1123282 RepID=A0A1M5Z429_9FIRM|nr:prepilin peptidase [Sporobacter termitidis]SHI18995.1 leader peptidase (prepilin peptidase) / N-methyltransferase [Sporobacter termitidis DSM 10068]
MDFLKVGAFLCIGAALGLLIPRFSYGLILHKCAKRQQEPPEFFLQRSYKVLLIILDALLFAAAGWLMPLPQACIVCIFIFTALISVIIDLHIRIICNEVVLLIFVTGIAYRLLDGGVYALLGSLAALGINLVIFGGAALVTKLVTKELGVGVGDVKLAAVIAVTVGYPGVLYFLGGLAVAVGVYCILGLIHRFLTIKSTFPMCGHIMFGFLIALFIPFITNIPL